MVDLNYAGGRWLSEDQARVASASLELAERLEGARADTAGASRTSPPPGLRPIRRAPPQGGLIRSPIAAEPNGACPRCGARFAHGCEHFPKEDL